MKRILIAALLATAFAAQAQSPSQKEIDRQIFVATFSQTSTCMHQAPIALMRQGVRDPAKLAAFAVMACGTPLRTLLLARPEVSEADAEAFILVLADNAAAAALARSK